MLLLYSLDEAEAGFGSFDDSTSRKFGNRRPKVATYVNAKKCDIAEKTGSWA